jgi:hypothetical protein
MPLLARFMLVVTIAFTLCGCQLPLTARLSPSAHAHVADRYELWAAIGIISLGLPLAFSLDLTLLWLAAVDGHTFEPFWLTRSLLEVIQELL